MKSTVREALLCVVLGFGSLMGLPMRPEQVEELMWAMSRPKVAETTPEEAEDPDWLTELLRRARGNVPSVPLRGGGR